MLRLHDIGIPTHPIRRLNMREQLIREVEIIPIKLAVRNAVAGSMAKRFGIEEGTPLPRSIVEYYWKNDEFGDPMVSEEHITAFGWAAPQDIDDMLALALRINDYLSGLFFGARMKLVDFKIEFGRSYDENGEMRIIIADEISPDTCRLWDVKTREKLDKDRFRRDLDGIPEAYQEVARRLGVLPTSGPGDVAPILWQTTDARTIKQLVSSKDGVARFRIKPKVARGLGESTEVKTDYVELRVNYTLP